MGDAGDAAGSVERQRRVRVDVEKVRQARQPQHPVVAGARDQVGKLDPPRGRRDQMQRQLLAGLGGGRAQLRDVQHGGQVAERVVDRRGGAGQADMAAVEMVVLVDHHRLAGDDAGPDRAGAGAVFRPFGAEIEPGLAQLVVEGRVAHELDGDAARIRQQKHVFLFGNLVEQRFQPAAADADKFLRLLAVLAQLRLRNDIGFLRLGRVEPVVVDAAQPRLDDGHIPSARPAHGDALDLPDVRQRRHHGYFLPGAMLAWEATAHKARSGTCAKGGGRGRGDIRCAQGASGASLPAIRCASAGERPVLSFAGGRAKLPLSAPDGRRR